MIVKESLGRGSYGMVYHIEVDKLPYALKRVQ